ncbi:MAG: CbiX/SirB N-terminal domain-containing protein [Bacteroidetes bacterium]|nr:CbiX/SirB N-terminal domain-containing protein [Bacteroidota bacterium]
MYCLKHPLKSPTIILAFMLAIGIFSCKNATKETATTEQSGKKIGVLLVNHGSRSDAWRASLLDLDKHVRDSIMAGGKVGDVKTAFMEYTEPSIATRLKEFDKEHYSDVIIVPVFLTVSGHSFDDIPTLVGLKDDPQSIEAFKIENMERYKPQAKVHITPLLDFTDILKKNILRRYKNISKDAANEGLVLIAYGDKTYNTEWTKLMTNVGDYVKQNTTLTNYDYGWCGHIAHYSPDSTTLPVNRILKEKKEAVVIPVLVAFDEMFQGKIIPDGIKKVKDAKEHVLYKPDAILPDGNVESWVINTSRDFTDKILNNTIAAAR